MSRDIKEPGRSSAEMKEEGSAGWKWRVLLSQDTKEPSMPSVEKRGGGKGGNREGGGGGGASLSRDGGSPASDAGDIKLGSER